MDEASRNVPAPAGELDLAVILGRTLAYFRKYARVFVITCGLGIAISILFIKLIPKTYTARMILESTVLNAHEQVEIVTDWDELLNQKGYPVLAAYFGCKPGLVSEITSLKAEIVGTPGEGNASFSVEADTQDTTLLPRIQDAILYGFMHNDYNQRKVAIRKDALSREIVKAREQLSELDSTGGLIHELRGGSKTGSQYILDISTIPEERLTLMERLTGYQEKLAFTDIQVLQGFVLNKKRKPSGLAFLLGGIAVGFLIGYFYTLLKMARSAYKKA